jgi:CheY-like chemotaxis protein
MAGHILVLDDEERYALMLQELLREHRFLADISTDPRDALEQLRARHYDLVVADYKMPVIDGAEFLTKARKSNPALPVIMVSGLMNIPELLKVANIGVTLVLEKPFNTEEFISYVRRFVEPLPDEDAVPGGEDAAGGSFDDGAPIAWTYPQPAALLADQSRDGRLFVQSFWDFSQSMRHVWIEVPPGGEWELAQQEWMAWRGDVAGVPRLQFALEDLANEEARRDFIAWSVRDDHGSVVAITVHGEAVTPENLADFVCFVEEQRSLRDRCVFLYSLPFGFMAQPSVLGLPQNLAQLCAPVLLKVTDLRHRPADVVEYARRLTRDDNRTITWDPRAVGLLLAYDWPGNYQELQAAIRRASLRLDDAGRLPHAALEVAIRWRQGDFNPRGSDYLESFLLRRQTDFLQSLNLPDAGWQAAAASAGMPVDRMRAGAPPDQQPLLFPQLLANTPVASFS